MSPLTGWLTQGSLCSWGQPHEQTTGIRGGGVDQAERCVVSRRFRPRQRGGISRGGADRAPGNLRLWDQLAREFGVLPVLAAGWGRRGLLPARRLGHLPDLSGSDLDKALVPKPCPIVSEEGLCAGVGSSIACRRRRRGETGRRPGLKNRTVIRNRPENLSVSGLLLSPPWFPVGCCLTTSDGRWAQSRAQLLLPCSSATMLPGLRPRMLGFLGRSGR